MVYSSAVSSLCGGFAIRYLSLPQTGRLCFLLHKISQAQMKPQCVCELTCVRPHSEDCSAPSPATRTGSLSRGSDPLTHMGLINTLLCLTPLLYTMYSLKPSPLKLAAFICVCHMTGFSWWCLNPDAGLQRFVSLVGLMKVFCIILSFHVDMLFCVFAWTILYTFSSFSFTHTSASPCFTPVMLLC